MTESRFQPPSPKTTRELNPEIRSRAVTGITHPVQ